MKAQAQKDAEAALAEPLAVYRESSSTEGAFIGGDAPSIADIRLAATLEFLRAIDYPFPASAEEYVTAVEMPSARPTREPAADVRGFVAQVKGGA